MSNKKRFNPNSAFEAIVSTPSPEPETTSVAEKEKKTKLIQTGFYITETQHKALKMKALMEDKDMSTIIRELIDEGVGEYMK